MSKELLLTATAFGLFVVCPRMAGMTHILKTRSQTPMIATVLLGVLVSIPLLLLMLFVFSKAGVWGALAVCVATDLGAALLMREISFSAGIETLIIAVFVITGVKTAPLISGMFHAK